MGYITPLLGLALSLLAAADDKLPTNYEYYTSEGISSGLSADQDNFLLNGKNITIYGGALHYFRVPRAYWRIGLRKIRAAGLNIVETYAPWNLHEPQSGVYDFGDGGSEMEDFLHLEEFLELAKEEDLFVILRPGPYICAEYNFGGFPSWLLRENQVGFRTSDETYLKYVERYFKVLLPLVAEYQFTKGGSIIGFQIENEYGFSPAPEEAYVRSLYQFFVNNGIVELLMTSDPPSAGMEGTIPDLMYHAVNFGDSPETNFGLLSKMQPGKPLMAMEFWTGWFDFWGGEHNARDADVFKTNYEGILKYPGSVNLYIFIGGTNFGSLNGASLINSLLDNSGFDPVTTSYDYDSPVTEAGDYTEKYYAIKELIEKYNPIKTLVPEVPNVTARVAYPSIRIQRQILFDDVLTYYSPYELESESVVAMELLDINNKSGQTYGYIVYRKENVDLEENTVLTIEGHVCDTVMVLVDGVLVSPALKSIKDFDGFGYWKLENSTLLLNTEEKKQATIDIVVEEWGRMNGGNLQQYNRSLKGLWQGDVYLNDEKVSNWKIIPLELKRDWTNSLDNWSYLSAQEGPAFYYVDLEISEEPTDTYLDMRQWTKGTATVNGLNLGKYLKFGPQLALYVPGPFLKKGKNRIVIFEHFNAPDEVVFSDDPIYGIQE